MQSYDIPKGMRDLLMEESSRRSLLQEKLCGYLKSGGFNRIETALFEYYELFSGGFSPIEDENITKVIDREGKVVVLRPDMTIPAARVAATKLKAQLKPLKLCYSGNVYRTDQKVGGGVREICQLGAEIFGGSAMWADIELLSLIRGCFREASIEGYKIDIGHMGIVEGIFSGLDIRNENKNLIMTLIREKNLVELESVVAGLGISDRHKELITGLPCFFGAPDDVFGKIGHLVINSRVQEAVDYLYEIYQRCRELGLESKLIIDAGMTGGINYYTGLIFRAYAKGAGSPVISGGRYDGLMRELGSDCPAAGFAVDMDNLIRAAAFEAVPTGRERRTLVLYSSSRLLEALEYAESRRKAGCTASLIYQWDISEPGQYAKQYEYNEIAEFI